MRKQLGSAKNRRTVYICDRCGKDLPGKPWRFGKSMLCLACLKEVEKQEASQESVFMFWKGENEEE